MDGEEITKEQAEQLSYVDKARLIQSDPYICATYFETRLQALRKAWSCPPGPFGTYQIDHFYYRIEFQHRGSPHAHIMLWLKGASVFKPGDVMVIPRIVNFIDNIITCNSEDIESLLFELQRHKHMHICHPKPGGPCRFGIPFYPHDSTIVLTELNKEEPSYKNSKKLARELNEKLNNIPEDITTFENLLQYVDLTK